MEQAADEDKGSGDDHTPVREPKQFSSLRSILSQIKAERKRKCSINNYKSGYIIQHIVIFLSPVI